MVPSTKRSVVNDIVSRVVHKNNTIFYEGNRYSLPLGTYKSGRTVSLVIDGDTLKIYDYFDCVVIAEHKISKNKGELVQNNNHKRDTTEKLDSIQGVLLDLLGNSEEADVFLRQVRCLKARYARDQFDLAKEVIHNYSTRAIEKALVFCVSNSLFSAVEFRNAAEYFEARLEKELEQIADLPKIILFKPIAATKKRDLSAYEQVVKGGDSS